MKKMVITMIMAMIIMINTMIIETMVMIIMMITVCGDEEDGD